MFARDAIVSAEHALGLVPKVLDAVDVMAALGDEGLAVIDAPMFEPRHIENVMAGQAVGIDYGIR